MKEIDEILKNRDELMLLLGKIPVNTLADAISIRQNVVALRQDGMQVIMFPNKTSQTA